MSNTKTMKNAKPIPSLMRLSADAVAVETIIHSRLIISPPSRRSNASTQSRSVEIAIYPPTKILYDLDIDFEIWKNSAGRYYEVSGKPERALKCLRHSQYMLREELLRWGRKHEEILRMALLMQTTYCINFKISALSLYVKVSI